MSPCMESSHAGSKSKTLVLCFDGTADEFDDKNTNVVKFFSMLDKSDSKRQVVYYQTGIGTYGPPGIMSKIGLWIASMLDYAFAWYLEAHVIGGYQFIMESYEPGDKICLFGFSRGAYTARVLAAMLYKVGLLPRYNGEHIPFAWKIFRDSKNEHNFPAEDVRRWHSLNFKRTFSREVEIDFIGIWDTVSSVGLIPRTLSSTADNPIVRNVIHAVSLDEVRAKFRTNLWHPQKPANDVSLDPMTRVHGECSEPIAGADYAVIAGGNSSCRTRNGDPNQGTNVEEVWFAGDHCDVGGGNTTYKEKYALSHIPLRWVVREAMKHTTIAFEPKVLMVYGIRLEPFSGLHASRTCSFEPLSDSEKYLVYQDEDSSLKGYRELERKDALSTEHSAFTGNKRLFWSILELIPLLRSIEFLGQRIYVFLPNLWRPRSIIRKQDPPPAKIHSSVRTRLREFKDPGSGQVYEIKAQLDEDNVIWIDDWATA